MSPASKSKSKDKKAGKEQQKVTSKPSGPNSGSSVPASAYNPLMGTFHTLELSPVSATSPLHTNGRFRNIDDTDENSGVALPSGVEYDSISNNGSWSGESEDHKDKMSSPIVRQKTIPGAENDKREKIRQKNERKHQRQKEKRAQELRERCTGYIMSRKLETLAQQLMAMGFSQEQSTIALILNEGRVEESVAWLFEGGEESEKAKDQNLGAGNLKIDISEELARIADMETRYNCSKQDVERAIVACEGDLEKAAETLRELKLEVASAPPKLEEPCDPPIVSNGKLLGTAGQNFRPQTKPSPPPVVQQRKDENDYNYIKTNVQVGGSTESVGKNMQSLSKIQPKLEWAKPQQPPMPAEKKWISAGSNPSSSYILTSSSLQVSPPSTKTETRYVAVGTEFKNLQSGPVREPVIMMQRPQSVNTKQVPATSNMSPSSLQSRHPTNGVEIMRSNGFLPHIHSTRSTSVNDLTSNQMYHQLQYQQQFIPGNSPADSSGTNRANFSWSRAGAPPTLHAASSLGLFSGLGSASSSGASSPLDWSNGDSSMHLDYTSIDWSLDRGCLSSSPRPSGGLWQGLNSFLNNSANMYESNASPQPTMRSVPSNSNGVTISGLHQDGGASSETSAAAGSREWTSPFEGKDLFILPRQFVSSPL